MKKLKLSKARLTFDMLEKEMEIINKHQATQFIGGSSKLAYLKSKNREMMFSIMVYRLNVYRKTLLLSMFLLCQSIFSQSQEWMILSDIDNLKSMKLVYKKPNKFNEVKGIDCFKNNLYLHHNIICGRNQLHSKNRDFIVFNMIDIYIYDEKKNFKAVLVGSKPTYLALIKKDIRTSLRKKKSSFKIPMSQKIEEAISSLKEMNNENSKQFNWKEYVNFYQEKEALKKFNTDTAISYSIPLEPKYYYKGKYDNLWVLVIQKENKGFIKMYCFYKNMPKRKLARYKKKVEKIFRYKD